jgi:hypothetical protein
MFPMSRLTRLGLWAARVFIVAVVIFGVVVSQLNIAELALVLAWLPSTITPELPWGRGPLLHLVSAALILVSTIGIAVILIVAHSVLPTFVVVIAALYAVYGLVPAAFDLIMTVRSDLRVAFYQRRVQRGWPTSTL